jgi:hypothetical protein
MTLAGGLGQRKGDAGAYPDHRGWLDPELAGHDVGRAEADAADVARQPVRVVGDHLHRLGAVGLVDAHRPRGADPVSVQEQHDLADHLLLRPTGDDAGRAHGPDAGDLAQPGRLGLDQVEHRGAEGADQLAGVNRADAADHAGAEILLDALGGGGLGGPEEACPELQAVGAVVGPAARELHPLAGRDGGGVPHHRDQIALPAGLDPQHAEAVLGIVVGDALDQPGQRLGGQAAVGGRS